MLYGLLVDLVPYGERFLTRERMWVNGALREWWSLDGLLTGAEFQRRHEQRLAQSNRVAFGIQTKRGEPIGVFALVNIDWCNRHAEVAAGIGDPAYWGGGFGSDGMLLIVDYAFRQLDLRRLGLATLEHNFRAQRQVEKCGFIREAVRRQLMLTMEGRTCDFLFYGMQREEWPGREIMVERLGLRDKAAAQGL
jgi:RimJ/RimL family protein N-acetyltransferase